jgi:hypothetical protein
MLAPDVGEEVGERDAGKLPVEDTIGFSDCGTESGMNRSLHQASVTLLGRGDRQHSVAEGLLHVRERHSCSGLLQAPATAVS